MFSEARTAKSGRKRLCKFYYWGHHAMPLILKPLALKSASGTFREGAATSRLMNIKSGFNILKGTIKEFAEDNVLRLSAALAYYAIFSIGPLLAIIVGVVGLAFGSDSARQQIHHALQGMLGEGSAKMVDSMMAARSTGTSLVTTIVGVVALLFGAAG